MKQRPLPLALILAAGCLAREAEPMDGSTVVYRGLGETIAGNLLLATDGRLQCGRDGVAGFTASERVVQLTADGEALRGAGEVLASRCSDGAPARVVATGVDRIIGPLVYRRIDGVVFTLDGNGRTVDTPALNGATSCAFLVCIRDGMTIPNTAWHSTGLAVPSPLVDATAAAAYSGHFASERVLTLNGSVFAVVAATTTAQTTVSFARMDGLPSIDRLDGEFMYDHEGNAYYAGNVWAPEDPPHLQNGLSTTMLPAGTPTIDCPYPPEKFRTTCVGPTLVPRLKGARMGSIYFLATYALMPDGTVKCWATEPTRYPSTAPRCLSFD